MVKFTSNGWVDQMTNAGGDLCTYINSRLSYVELTDLSEPEIEKPMVFNQNGTFTTQNQLYKYWKQFTILLRVMTMFFESISLNV